MIDNTIKTNAGTIIGNGYERIVHGGRGDYIEMTDDQIVKSNIFIPQHALWRQKPKYDALVYYYEYRTVDVSFIKIYYQKKLVDYADYKIGYWYVSPSHLEIYKSA